MKLYPSEDRLKADALSLGESLCGSTRQYAVGGRQ